MQSWHRGDFFQYSRWEAIPEDERRRKYGNKPLTPFLRTTKDYFSKDPLILNGMVPVHTSCGNCNSWLEAYAKIVNGKFDRIVEAEATREEKQLVIIPVTAKKLREEFEKKLSHLQESCNHEKTRWTRNERTPDQPNLQTLVCRRCDKILGTRNPKSGVLEGRPKHWKEEENRADKSLADIATKLDTSAQAKRTSHD